MNLPPKKRQQDPILAKPRSMLKNPIRLTVVLATSLLLAWITSISFGDYSLDLLDYDDCSRSSPAGCEVEKTGFPIVTKATRSFDDCTHSIAKSGISLCEFSSTNEYNRAFNPIYLVIDWAFWLGIVAVGTRQLTKRKASSG